MFTIWTYSTATWKPHNLFMREIMARMVGLPECAMCHPSTQWLRDRREPSSQIHEDERMSTSKYHIS